MEFKYLLSLFATKNAKVCPCAPNYDIGSLPLAEVPAASTLYRWFVQIESCPPGSSWENIVDSFSHIYSGEMRRKEKRLLQFAGLLIAALLFLPNVGLWSLYRDRVFENSPEIVEGPGGIPQLQVRLARAPFAWLALQLKNLLVSPRCC